MSAGGSWDIHTAIIAAWNASSLTATFKALWDDANTSDYLVLNDTDARANTPFPYCIYTVDPGFYQFRSGHESDATKRRATDSVIVEFAVMSDDKDEAATLAIAIADVFTTGVALTVEGGTCFVHAKRGQDRCTRLGESAWEWSVDLEIWFERED